LKEAALKAGDLYVSLYNEY